MMAIGSGSSKKQLASESEGRCELLFAVHAVFVNALPKASSQLSLQEINYITLLRYEITSILTFFNVDCTRYYLSEDAFHDSIDSLDSILWLFENLVAREILDNRDPNLIAPQSDFPKLVSLKGRNSKESLQYCSQWISFGGRPSQRNAMMVAQGFNRKMAKIFSDINNDLNTSELCAEEDMTSLLRAEQLSEALDQLFELLKKTICRQSSGGHETRVRLSELGEQELEMMMSICINQSLWQQVYLDMGHLKNSELQGVRVEDICSELTQSYRNKKPLMMESDGKKICKSSNKKSRTTTAKELRTDTLRDILHEEERLRQNKISQYRTIRKTNKRRLGLLLATSLLHLYGTPFLQTTWSADAIHIRHRKSDTLGQDPVPEAYITCTLGSEPVKQQIMFEEPVPGDPFILALAALLVGLEMEEEVIVLDEDIDEISGKKSLYMALIRLQDDLKQYLEDVDPFADIIDACLQIYDGSSDTDSKKLRQELFTKVVSPLGQRDKAISNPWGLTTQPTAVVTRDTPSYTSHEPAGYAGPIIGRGPMATIAETPENEETEQEEKGNTFMQPIISRLCSSVADFNPLLLSSRGSISSSQHWLKEYDQVNKSLGALRRVPQAETVRIAILDTGCDLDASCIAGMPDAETRLNGHWKDFWETSAKPLDEDKKQHGTALAALLLRVAFHAAVFVGRVAKNEAGLSQATQNISQAIRYAAAEWKVDIITMSFGFPLIVREIEKAVAEVNSKRRDNNESEIVFFAAANNDGSNSKELFPASLETVISVRGTDHTGAFINKFSPNPWPQKERSIQYGTLGQHVPYDIGNPLNHMSGCSVATPILAGIAATIIQHVNSIGGADARTSMRLRTKEGVLQVLKHISEKEVSGHRRYVAPWAFFGWSEEERRATIVHALAELERHV